MDDNLKCDESSYLLYEILILIEKNNMIIHYPKRFIDWFYKNKSFYENQEL